MKLSELQSKKIIEINSGSAIGTIMDISLLDDGKVDYFIIEQGKNFFALNRESDTKIYWSQIVKIGEDVILVQKK